MQTCQLMEYSRQQFYEIRRNYQFYGAQGELDRSPSPASPTARYL